MKLNERCKGNHSPPPIGRLTPNQFPSKRWLIPLNPLLPVFISGHDSAGLGWVRVNFLRGSSYRAVLWICAENSIDNVEIFSLLLIL